METLIGAGPHGGRWTAWQIKVFVRKVVTGVAKLHALGYAHCDLKPENLLLQEKGKPHTVVIIDLGCARRAGTLHLQHWLGLHKKDCGTPRAGLRAHICCRDMDIDGALEQLSTYMALHRDPGCCDVAVSNENTCSASLTQGSQCSCFMAKHCSRGHCSCAELQLGGDTAGDGNFYSPAAHRAWLASRLYQPDTAWCPAKQVRTWVAAELHNGQCVTGGAA